MTKTMHTGTKNTMSLTHWRAAVLDAAHVSEEDADRILTRERIVRWFDAGEPVWMAADGVRMAVTVGLREERAAREVNYLAGKMKVQHG